MAGVTRSLSASHNGTRSSTNANATKTDILSPWRTVKSTSKGNAQSIPSANAKTANNNGSSSFFPGLQKAYGQGGSGAGTIGTFTGSPLNPVELLNGRGGKAILDDIYKGIQSLFPPKSNSTATRPTAAESHKTTGTKTLSSDQNVIVHSNGEVGLIHDEKSTGALINDTKTSVRSINDTNGTKPIFTNLNPIDSSGNLKYKTQPFFGDKKLDVENPAPQGGKSLTIKNGRFYGQDQKPLDTSSMSDGRVPFVMKGDGTFIYGEPGSHHRDINNDSEAAAAGEFFTDPKGKLNKVSDLSGGYPLDPSYTLQMIDRLQRANVDLSNVTVVAHQGVKWQPDTFTVEDFVKKFAPK
jgi:hypothetical protein